MAKKNAYSEEELISAGIITEEGVVIDPVRFRQYNAVLDVEKESKEREAENLKRAEKEEKRRLEKPGLLGKMLDGIDSVKRLMQRKNENEKKKEQQKMLEQKKRQQMAAGRGA
ncbi:MAG: hypothetical protein R8M37_00480 [Alphaproteobacteria bacterium]|nr:hypothetical protein [Alphaproteobacteria bacterium]